MAEATQALRLFRWRNLVLKVKHTTAVEPRVVPLAAKQYLHFL